MVDRSPVRRATRGAAFRRIVAVAVCAAMPFGIAHGQATSRADAALKLLDERQCEPAVDVVNQGMRDNEGRSFFIAGQLFQHGFCLVENKPRAARTYERGALAGDRESARALALMYARGDGVAQDWQQAGRWYSVMHQEKVGVAAPTPESFGTPDAIVKTYIEAVHDLAALLVAYPADALDAGVTGSVKVAFDPRFGRVRLMGSSDSTGGAAGATGPNRHDFERALLAAYADAIRVLPRPPMSPNVDNTSERTTDFARKKTTGGEPAGLQALPR